MGLGYGRCRVKLESLDCMESLQDSLIVLVTGLIVLAQQKPKSFIQHFLLVQAASEQPDEPTRYYIRNDIQRYLDHIPTQHSATNHNAAAAHAPVPAPAPVTAADTLLPPASPARVGKAGPAAEPKQRSPALTAQPAAPQAAPAPDDIGEPIAGAAAAASLSGFGSTPASPAAAANKATPRRAERKPGGPPPGLERPGADCSSRRSSCSRQPRACCNRGEQDCSTTGQSCSRRCTGYPAACLACCQASCRTSGCSGRQCRTSVSTNGCAGLCTRCSACCNCGLRCFSQAGRSGRCSRQQLSYVAAGRRDCSRL